MHKRVGELAPARKGAGMGELSCRFFRREAAVTLLWKAAPGLRNGSTLLWAWGCSSFPTIWLQGVDHPEGDRSDWGRKLG